MIDKKGIILYSNIQRGLKMIRIEHKETGKILIETELVRVEILEDVKWKSNKRTDVIKVYTWNGSEIEVNRKEGNYYSEVRVTKVKE